MSNEIVAAPSPEEDDDQSGRQSQNEARDHADGAHRSRRRRGRIPNRDECRIQLAGVPGLVATKFLTPAEANAITRALQTQLAECRTSPSAASALPVSENIIEKLRAQPELLEWVEPLLTDEQLAMVMKGVKDDSQPQA